MYKKYVFNPTCECHPLLSLHPRPTWWLYSYKDYIPWHVCTVHQAYYNISVHKCAPAIGQIASRPEQTVYGQWMELGLRRLLVWWIAIVPISYICPLWGDLRITIAHPFTSKSPSPPTSTYLCMYIETRTRNGRGCEGRGATTQQHVLFSGGNSHSACPPYNPFMWFVSGIASHYDDYYYYYGRE